MDWKPVRLLLALLSLYALYSLGVPLMYIAILGIIYAAAIFLREHIYKKIDDFLIGKFPSIAGWPKWGRALLAIVVFIAAYAILKQVLFELLKIAGIDVQQALLEGMNRSMGG
jgi:hypothetical protein